MQFILLYAKDEAECLQMYGDTSLMVKKIIDGFDIDPCKCFWVKWKCPVWEMPCLLKSSNSGDMIYMWVADKDVWPTEEHVLGWDHMWESGMQHGNELYTHVYHMCLNKELIWATKHAVAYVRAYELCLNSVTTHRERACNITVLSCGIRSLYNHLQKYVCRTRNISTVLEKQLNLSTIHKGNVLLAKMCLSQHNMKMQ